MCVILKDLLSFFKCLFWDDSLMSVAYIILSAFPVIDFSFCRESIGRIVFLKSGIACVTFIGKQVFNA